MKFFVFKVCMNYREHHTFTLCRREAVQSYACGPNHFQNIQWNHYEDWQSFARLVYVPKEWCFLLAAVVVVLLSFFTHNSSALSYSRISNCQMNPQSMCQALTGRVEKSSLYFKSVVFFKVLTDLCIFLWEVLLLCY